MEGKLITFEGIDGSGKSTLSKRVYGRIKKEHDAVYAKEPTSTWLGNGVKRAIEERLNPFSETFLFMADHAELVRRIERWKKEGKIIITDRYNDSCYAYQGVMLKGRIKNPIQRLQKFSAPFTVKPDLTFLLVLEPELALSRISRVKTKFESLEVLREVQQNYLKLAGAEKERWIKLDGAKEISKLVEETIARIEATYRS